MTSHDRKRESVEGGSHETEIEEKSSQSGARGDVSVCALGVTAVASPGVAVPSVDDRVTFAENPSSQAEVAKLSQRLREAIRMIEKSQAPCEIRRTVVRRLRLVDDALWAGRRTGAAALLHAWRARAESMAQSGTLSASLSGTLQQRLTAVRDEVGTGWPEKPRPTRHWPALPACDAVVGADASGDVWSSADTLTLIQTTLRLLPTPAGGMLAGLVTIMWPSDTSQPDITDLIDTAMTEEAQADASRALQTVFGILDVYQQRKDFWVDECATGDAVRCSTAAALLKSTYDDTVGDLSTAHEEFTVDDYPVELLPLYAQYENLYLSLLREGLVEGSSWGITESEKDALYRPEIYRALEQRDGDPEAPEDVDQSVDETGIGWVDKVYSDHVKALEPTKDSTGVDQAEWAEQNKYIRETTLNVLDFRDMWSSMDPDVYPQGNPDLKLTRMIFSDPYGAAEAYGQEQFRTSGFNPPTYKADRLMRLEAWQDANIFWLRDHAVVDALRLTHGTVAGPIMGDSAPEDADDYFTFGLDPDSYVAGQWGPVTKVRVGVGCCDLSGVDEFLVGLTFYWAREGLPPVTVGSYSTMFHIDEVDADNYEHYEDEVLATARIMRATPWRYDQESADAIVLGFRFDDSY